MWTSKRPLLARCCVWLHTFLCQSKDLQRLGIPTSGAEVGLAAWIVAPAACRRPMAEKATKGEGGGVEGTREPQELRVSKLRKGGRNSLGARSAWEEVGPVR